MAGEFALIKRLCQQIPTWGNSGPDLGPGDDAAVVTVPEGQQLVVTTDTLNAGVHFFPDADPASVGYKSLAVNLSDLAAMAALPRWVSLSISLPVSGVDLQAWIDAFADGFAQLASQHQVALTGGDLTSGPLSVSVTAMGLVPRGTAVQRSGAQPGDKIIVSGTLGDAAGALQLMRTEQPVPEVLQRQLLRPQPQVSLGLALREVASSMIDISDGLLADIGHLLTASRCGGNLFVHQLPVSKTLKTLADFDWSWPLTGGDDYQLCFTLAPRYMQRLTEISNAAGVELSVIGEVTAQREINCYGSQGELITPEATGWTHF